jgi:hypothetical protein
MEIRTSKLGREYQVLGICKVPDTTKWIDRIERSHYCERIKFLDNGETTHIYYDYQNKVYKKEKEPNAFLKPEQKTTEQ